MNKVDKRIKTIMKWIEEDGGIHLLRSCPMDHYTEKDYKNDKLKLAIFYYDMLSSPSNNFPSLEMRADRKPIAYNLVNYGKGAMPIKPEFPENPYLTAEILGLPNPATAERDIQYAYELAQYESAMNQYNKDIAKWNADNRPEYMCITDPIY